MATARRWSWMGTALVLGLVGCSAPATQRTDAGNAADAAVDAGHGGDDAGNVDAGLGDSGSLDAGLVDAGDVDAGAPDAGDVDAGGDDAGAPVDAGDVSDAGMALDGGDQSDAGTTVDAGTAIDGGGATDPCATNNGGCDANASCNNEGGHAVCQCNVGYTGNGQTCAPVQQGGQLQLSTSTAYRFAWPAVGEAALVASVDPSGAQTGLWTGTLHLLSKGGADTTLSSTVLLNSIEVNLAGAKPSAVWLQDVNSSGVGKAYFADLSASPVTPKLLNSTALAINHAGAGNQVLITGDVVTAGQPGSLRWSDGSTVSPIVGGAGQAASNSAIQVSGDKKLVVAAVNLASAGPSAQTGDLWAINFRNGTSTLLATGTLAIVNDAPAFAVSNDGSVVAYMDSVGALYAVANVGGAPQLITTSGNVPALSADGSLVAYTSSASPAGAYVAEVASPFPYNVGAYTGSTAAAPIFTPDGNGLVYFKNVVDHSGLIGDAYITATDGSTNEVLLGKKVAISSIHESPFYQPVVAAPNTCGGDFLVNGSLLDQSQLNADWFGLGQLTWLNLQTCAGVSEKATVLQTLNSSSQKVAIRVSTSDMTVLQDGSAAAFTGDYTFSTVSGETAAGDLYVLPFADLANPTFAPVATGVQSASIRSSPVAPRVLFAQNAAGYAADNKTTFTATIQAADGSGKLTPIASSAFTWWDPHLGVEGYPFAVDGRAIVILPAASGGLAAGVWLLPVP